MRPLHNHQQHVPFMRRLCKAVKVLLCLRFACFMSKYAHFVQQKLTW